MRKLVSIIRPTCFCLFVLSCFGQSGQPTQTPYPSADDVVRISTTLIQVDATVTDNAGKIITDLTAEDFEIYENNVRQNITSFAFVSAGSKAAATLTRNDAKPGLPNTPIKPEQVRRTIALVVDDLTLTFQKVPFVRSSLRKFVDEQMREGDLVAIARTGGSIGILQQFTSNRRQLYAAIEKIRWNPLGRGGPKIDVTTPSIIGSSTGLRDPDKEAKSVRESVIAARTISGLNYMISGMKGLPGRKSAIIFSEGFKVINRDLLGPETDYRIKSALEKLFDLAARSSVVVSTIDARGLEPERDADFDDQQDGLEYLAKQTGGVSIKDNNDLNFGIEKILNNQKAYYLIGYTPDSKTFDPAKRRFNKVVVKVKREGATVRYRSGFFGLSEEKEARVNQNSSERLRAALTSPFAVNDIAINLNTLFGNDAEQGSFVRSLLHINAKDLKFTEEAGGTLKAHFDVLAISFNTDGVPIDKIVKDYELTLPPREYQKFLAEGFVYYFTFPIKKPGAYQFRVAIRDRQSQKIGSASQFIEIPNLKNDGLTLSGVVLESLTREQSQREEHASPNDLTPGKFENQSGSSMLVDTSLKHFKRDTVLRYGFEVYNAKLDIAQKPQLTTRINVFRDGKLVLEGKPSAVDLTGQQDWQKITSFGELVLGSEMSLGEYVLQIIVTDNLAKGKGQSTLQFVQFEIV